MKIRSGLLAAAVLFTGSSIASAHSVNNYPTSAGWKYTILNRVFYQAPNNWPNAYNNRAEDAMTKWTNVSGSAISFSLAGNASTDSWSCGTDWDLVTTANFTSGACGSATLCNATNSTVRIRINTDYTWYTGSTTPNPNNQPDLQATITHELGHAHQAWAECTNGASNDPCPGHHYDPSNNGLICDSSELTNYHTMCSPAPSTGETWRRRSLETHDEDLVQAMY
jgi:hypothetical protein